MFTCSFILAQKMTKKWFYVLGFIGIVIQFAGLLILGGVLLLSKWNLITRYPVIFNFRVGTGRVLEKKFGTGRVPGSRRTLPARLISTENTASFTKVSNGLWFANITMQRLGTEYRKKTPPTAQLIQNTKHKKLLSHIYACIILLNIPERTTKIFLF